MLYEYKCDCGYTDIIEHGMEESIKEICIKCGKEMRKVFGAGVQFKGSGFYVNDYKKTG